MAIETPSASSGSVSGFTSPVGVTRSIRASELSVIQRVPSPAAAMPAGLAGSGSGKVAISPFVVIEPMPSPVVNQRRSSGPATIGPTSAGTVVSRYGSSGTGNSVISPAGVIRPTLAAPPRALSANQAFPSGPAALAVGL